MFGKDVQWTVPLTGDEVRYWLTRSPVDRLRHLLNLIDISRQMFGLSQLGKLDFSKASFPIQAAPEMSDAAFEALLFLPLDQPLSDEQFDKLVYGQYELL